MLCYHWFFHPIPCVYIITFSSISSILSTAFLFLWMLHSYYLSFFLCGCWCLESLLIKFLCIKDNNSLLVAIISSFCHLSFFKYSYGVNLSFKIVTLVWLSSNDIIALDMLFLFQWAWPLNSFLSKASLVSLRTGNPLSYSDFMYLFGTTSMWWIF